MAEIVKVDSKIDGAPAPLPETVDDLQDKMTESDMQERKERAHQDQVEEHVEEHVVHQSDSLNMAASAASDDNLRLDTVIKIKSDLSLAEEKKEDDEEPLQETEESNPEATNEEERTDTEAAAEVAPEKPEEDAEAEEEKSDKEQVSESPEAEPEPEAESPNMPATSEVNKEQAGPEEETSEKEEALESPEAESTLDVSHGDAATAKESSEEQQMEAETPKIEAESPNISATPEVNSKEGGELAETSEPDTTIAMPSETPADENAGEQMTMAVDETEVTEAAVWSGPIDLFGDDEEEEEEEAVQETLAEEKVKDEAVQETAAEETLAEEEVKDEAVQETPAEETLVEEEVKDEPKAVEHDGEEKKEAPAEDHVSPSPEEAKETSEAPAQDSETPKTEAPVVTAPPSQSAESGDEPSGKAAETTGSIDSDQPMTDAVVTTKSASSETSGEKSSKSVHFAEDTIVSMREEMDAAEEADRANRSGVGGIFACGEPLCGSIFGVDESAKDEIFDDDEDNSIVSEEDVEETRAEEVTQTTEEAVEAASSPPASESDAVEQAQEKAEDSVAPESPKAPDDDPIDDNGHAAPLAEGAKEPLTDNDQRQAVVTEEAQTEKETAPEESNEKLADAAVGGDNVNDILTLVGATNTAVATSPVAHHLEHSPMSFDVQQGMSCAAVFSCGVMVPEKEVEEPKPRQHIPMTFSQDLIMEARDEAEREVEARTLQEANVPDTPTDAGMTENEDAKIVVGESPPEGQPSEKESAEEQQDTDGDQLENTSKQDQASPTDPMPAPHDNSQPQPIVSDESHEGQPRSDAQAKPLENETTPEAPQVSLPIVVADKSEDVSPLPEDAALPMPAPMKGVIVEELDEAARAQQEAYACGCTIL